VFGFVTKAQLDVYREELRADYQRAADDQAAVMRKIKVEWEEWWEKFSRLYARLSKRVKDAEREGGTPGKGDGEIVAPGAPQTIDPARIASWRAKRGF
jgi:hypothetical protein